MAKFAICGYGSKGEGVGPHKEGYTYVVNDNVRSQSLIQVVATSKANRKFATTAKALNVYKETSVKGQEAKQRADQAIAASEQDKNREITRSYTGTELGVRALKSTPQYREAVRAQNIAKYKQEYPEAELTPNAQETFDSYSKKFMKKEEQ